MQHSFATTLHQGIKQHSFRSSASHKTQEHDNWPASQATVTSSLAFRSPEMHPTSSHHPGMAHSVFGTTAHSQQRGFSSAATKTPQLKAFDGRCTCVAFTTDDKWVITRASERKVTMWVTETGAKTFSFNAPDPLFAYASSVVDGKPLRYLNQRLPTTRRGNQKEPRQTTPSRLLHSWCCIGIVSK